MMLKSWYFIHAICLLFFVFYIGASDQHSLILTNFIDTIEIDRQNIIKSSLLGMIINFNKRIKHEVDFYNNNQVSTNEKKLFYVPSFFDLSQLLGISVKPIKMLKTDEIVQLLNYIDFFRSGKIKKNKCVHELYVLLCNKINKISSADYSKYNNCIENINNSELKDNSSLILLCKYLRKNNTLTSFFTSNNIIVFAKNNFIYLTDILKDNNSAMPILLSKSTLAIPFIYKQKFNACILYDYNARETKKILVHPHISSNLQYAWGVACDGTEVLFDIKNNNIIKFQDFFPNRVFFEDLCDIFDHKNYLLGIKKITKNNIQFSELIMVKDKNTFSLGLVSYRIPSFTSSHKKIYHLTINDNTTLDFSVIWIDPKNKNIYKINFSKKSDLIDKHLFMNLMWNNKIAHIKLNQEKKKIHITSSFSGKHYAFLIKKMMQKRNITEVTLNNYIASAEEAIQNKNMCLSKTQLVKCIDIYYGNSSSGMKSFFYLRFKNLITGGKDEVRFKDIITYVQYKNNNFLLKIGSCYYIFNKKELRKWLEEMMNF